MAEAALPELVAVPWRARVDARWLRRWGRLWTLQTLAFVIPFTLAGIALIALELQHLKWIVWEHWDCRRCGVKHRECGHGEKLVKFF